MDRIFRSGDLIPSAVAPASPDASKSGPWACSRVKQQHRIPKPIRSIFPSRRLIAFVWTIPFFHLCKGDQPNPEIYSTSHEKDADIAAYVLIPHYRDLFHIDEDGAILSAPANSYYSADLRYPLVIAHKGGNALWPGNTIYAFRQAVNLGVDAIETDVRALKDGVLMLMHDGRVEHSTDGSGHIEDMSLAEIQQLDAAYGWSRDDGQTFPFRGQKLSVPTLEEVFQAFPATRFVLDVKGSHPQIAERLCALILLYQMDDKVVVAAVSDAVVRSFRKSCPEVASAAAFGEVARFVFPQKVGLEGWFSSRSESLQGPYDPWNLYDDFIISGSYLRDAHARNVKVEPWADDAITMQHYVDLGVDGMITDHPDVLLDLLQKCDTTWRSPKTAFMMW